MKCVAPVLIKNENRKNDSEYAYHRVPCGRCAGCKTRRSREWIFRIEQELKISASAFFVTLTYEDEYLPWSESGVPTLHKPDFQKYIKRLRKHHKKNRDSRTIKYYACGEYGKRTKRPHYHAIILNAYQQDIEEKWEHGLVHVGNVTQDSIAYNTKYILKENEQYQLQFKEDKSFIREFSLMSKGIGLNYVTKHTKQYHKQNLDKPYLVDAKGFKYSIPRIYKDRLFTEAEKTTIAKIGQAHAEKSQEERDSTVPAQKQVDQDVHKEYLFNKRTKQKQQKL